MDSGDALALISSNALTIGMAGLAWHTARQLLQATHVVAALSFLAVDGSHEAYAERVHAGRPHFGQVSTATEMRRLLGAPVRRPARIQDPFGYRCFPQIHGPAVDATAELGRVLEEHSSFAFQSARQSLGSLTAFRLVLACELVAAVRALRMRDIAPNPDTPLYAAHGLLASKLNPDVRDRQLSPDVELAASLLDEL
jgi:histidine ammonia-lyase